MTFHHVRAWGIELEGGWDHECGDYRHWKTDGSVEVRGDRFVGELATPPLTSWAETKRYLRGNYPDHVGQSCGMHVHLSFRSMVDYSALIDSEAFMDDYVRTMLSWAKRRKVKSQNFQDRLAGHSSYARLRWMPDAVWTGDRYHVVNFAAWRKFRTVEIRVLPMFRSRMISLSAIRHTLAYTEDYCRKAPVRRLGTDVDLAVDIDGVGPDDAPLIRHEVPLARTSSYRDGIRASVEQDYRDRTSGFCPLFVTDDNIGSNCVECIRRRLEVLRGMSMYSGSARIIALSILDRVEDVHRRFERFLNHQTTGG